MDKPTMALEIAEELARMVEFVPNSYGYPITVESQNRMAGYLEETLGDKVGNGAFAGIDMSKRTAYCFVDGEYAEVKCA